MMLDKLPHHFFSSAFVKCLLDRFWRRTQREILFKQFMPYFAFTVVSLFYFHHQLKGKSEDLEEEEEESKSEVLMSKVLGICVLLYLPYAFRTEYFQFRAAKPKKKYCCDTWNWVDISGISLTALITVQTVFDLDWISIEQLRIMAAFASSILILKFYDYMRLFSRTAFYV